MDVATAHMPSMLPSPSLSHFAQPVSDHKPHQPSLSKSQQQSQRKKRARPASDSSDEGGDRKRGRPRVDKHDESAADRRRTQIRMAQRAYRQRKESTLEELRSRVTDLSGTLNRVERAFATCCNMLSATGLTADQMYHLQEAKLEIEEALRSGGSDLTNASGLENVGSSAVGPQPSAAAAGACSPMSSESGSSVKRSIKASHSPPHISQMEQQPQQQHNHHYSHPVPQHAQLAQMLQEDPSQYARRQVKNVTSWLDPIAVEQSHRPRQRTDVGMGYSVYPADVPIEMNHQPMVNGFDLPAETQAMIQAPVLATSRPAMQQNNGYHQQQQQQQDYSAPRLFTQLGPLRTLSEHETTFARWIHRWCTELGYQLLVNPARKPDTYERVFRLNLLGADRANIMAAFKSTVDRGGDEGLDNWHSPFVHIGGAGTHYPRRDRNGAVLPMKHASFGIGMVGPQPLVSGDSRMSVDMAVQVAGCEGEWFDPYDVQGYVESKGIVFQPGVSFAQAEIVEWPSSASAASSSTSSSRSSAAGRSSPSTSSMASVEDVTNGGSSGTVSDTGYKGTESQRWNRAEQLEHLSQLGTEVDMDRWDESTMTVVGPGVSATSVHQEQSRPTQQQHEQQQQRQQQQQQHHGSWPSSSSSSLASSSPPPMMGMNTTNNTGPPSAVTPVTTVSPASSLTNWGLDFSAPAHNTSTTTTTSTMATAGRPLLAPALDDFSSVASASGFFAPQQPMSSADAAAAAAAMGMGMSVITNGGNNGNGNGFMGGNCFDFQGAPATQSMSASAMGNGAFGGLVGFGGHGHGHGQGLSHGPVRKNVLIEWTRFVKILATFTVCLGRSPGFRRRDVDRALALASWDVDIF